MVEADRDNTIYEASDGSLSNGKGAWLFAGKTNRGDIRRALIRFDVAGALPSGAVIETVRLELNMSQTISGNRGVSLHRVSADWGEGTSDASANEGRGTQAEDNDATWMHQFYNTVMWQNAGGDFTAAASGSLEVGSEGPYVWESTPELVSDVQSWLDEPEANFGWMLIGDESANATAKRFDSRENPTPENQPKLRVTYKAATNAEAESLPAVAELRPAWPNPFVTSTRLAFELASDAWVSLEIFDVVGRPVSVLLDQRMSPGRHEVQFDAKGLPAGLYVYRLHTAPAQGAGGGIQTGTLVHAE